MRDDTLPLSHFERIYERGADPWHFADSAYEQAKYAATLHALPRSQYCAAFEIGCSIGVLTALLADRCDALLAVEPVEVALRAARDRCRNKPWVAFRSMFVPSDWPDGQFDLIVISEVLDYIGASDLAILAERLRTSLIPGGDLILVHWLGKRRGEPPSSNEASEVLLAACAGTFSTLHQDRGASYRLDCLRRVGS